MIGPVLPTVSLSRAPDVHDQLAAARPPPLRCATGHMYWLWHVRTENNAKKFIMDPGLANNTKREECKHEKRREPGFGLWSGTSYLVAAPCLHLETRSLCTAVNVAGSLWLRHCSCVYVSRFQLHEETEPILPWSLFLLTKASRFKIFSAIILTTKQLH